MACITLPLPPPLPSVGPIGLPTFSLPAFSGGVDLCCQFNLLARIKLPVIPPIPGLDTVIAAINTEVGLLNLMLAQLYSLNLSCPLDDGPVSITA